MTSALDMIALRNVVGTRSLVGDEHSPLRVISIQTLVERPEYNALIGATGGVCGPRQGLDEYFLSNSTSSIACVLKRSTQRLGERLRWCHPTERLSRPGVE
jgi:hypothetical protein